MITHQFDKKRGMLTLEHINDELAIVIESHFVQYQGTTTHTRIGSPSDSESYYLQRKQELSPPKVRKDHNTRI